MMGEKTSGFTEIFELFEHFDLYNNKYTFDG